jgi:hypothetical protein
MNRTGKTPNRARLWLTGVVAICGCATVFAQSGRFGAYETSRPAHAGTGAAPKTESAAIQRLRQEAGVAKIKEWGTAGGGGYSTPRIGNDDEGTRKISIRGRADMTMPVMPVWPGEGHEPVIPVPGDTGKEPRGSISPGEARDICGDAAAAYIPVREKPATPQRAAYFAACLEEQLPANLTDVAKASIGLSIRGSTTIFCSGVLVEPGVLITAKHCFFDAAVPHLEHKKWDRLKEGEVEMVSDLGRLAVTCRQTGDTGVDATVIDCAYKQYGAFGLVDDLVVLHVPTLAATGFKGLKKAAAAPKVGAGLLLYVHFDATSNKRRFTKTGCSVRETASSCVVHDCQADHGSSGGGLLLKGPDGQLLAGGIHLAGATRKSQCGFGATVTSSNVGITLP